MHSTQYSKSTANPLRHYGESIFARVKAAIDIADVVEKYGVKLNAKGQGLCPFHQEKTGSFSVKKSTGTFKCFGCGQSGDAIAFVSKLKNIDPLDAACELAELYHLADDTSVAHQPRDKRADLPVKGCGEANCAATRRINDYISACAAAVSRTDYWKRRGLNDDTIRRFNLGFDEQKHVVVIPYSAKCEYYQTRSTGSKEFRKPKTEEAGSEPLFNPDAITAAKNGAVFVVESPICALSIEQSGGYAISTCGTQGGAKLLAEVKKRKPSCVFVLAFDNDEAGQKAQKELSDELGKLGARHILYNIAGIFKDPNEQLMAEPLKLSANIKAATIEARGRYSKLTKLFNASELQKKRIRPIRWIVQGLLSEGVVMLCAPSKFGKSWMMMQLCTSICQGKPFLGYQTNICDCAYFSLEDSERRFQSRLNITMAGAAAPSNFYGSIELSSMANGLFDELTELVETYPRIGLIVIDTFQRVRHGQGKSESAYSADYREIGGFKTFAEKHGVCILLVHHLRKQVDDSDVYNMINGSMGLMGASDAVWILSRKKREETNTSFTATGRDIGDTNLILTLDKSVFHWQVIGTVDDQTKIEAKREYDNNLVIQTVKALVEKYPQGWRGNCTEIKTQIYEQSGELYTRSVESIGKVISNYKDRLLADGITHREERGKRHFFEKKRQPLEVPND